MSDKRHNLPRVFFTLPAIILYVAVCPIFYLVFSIMYDPFGIMSLLDMGRGLSTLNIMVIFCIILVVLVGTRTAFYFLRDMERFTWAHYILWCMGECLVIALFLSLYLTLMFKGAYPYFTVLFQFCIGGVYTILIYPYTIITLAYDVRAHREVARQKLQAVDDSSLVRFFDQYGKLKLIIAQGALLFIRAEENYVNINYLDAGKPKSYVLRTSMRSLEDNAERHGLVRCQRSYFVNPDHIKVLRKDKEGAVFAELDCNGRDSIPVSKRYIDKVSERL